MSSKGSSRILEWVAILSPGDLPDPGIELGSPALQADSLPTELWGKPICRSLDWMLDCQTYLINTQESPSHELFVRSKLLVRPAFPVGWEDWKLSAVFHLLMIRHQCFPVTLSSVTQNQGSSGTFRSVSVHVCVHVQSCPALCDPTGCSSPGSSFPGISQATMLEGVVFSFSRGSSWPRDQTPISCISCTGHDATWETLDLYLPTSVLCIRKSLPDLLVSFAFGDADQLLDAPGVP